MNEPTSPPVRHSSTVKVSRDGQVVATAEVTTDPDGTARVALQTPHDAPPAIRRDLVDEVMDSPDVRGSENVHVVVPLGDSESITRLQDRTTGFNARAAGASSVIEAEVARPEDDR